CSGAMLDSALKKVAAARMGVRIVEAYGLTEFGMVASECAQASGLHLDGDVVAEVLDHKNRPVSDGFSGALTLSSVRNTAYPLVRYRTDDQVVLDHSPCRCGRATPRIVELLGRTMRNFRLPSGAPLSPTRFHDFFRFFPVREFQLVQSALDRFTLLVEPEDERSIPL